MSPTYNNLKKKNISDRSFMLSVKQSARRVGSGRTMLLAAVTDDSEAFHNTTKNECFVYFSTAWIKAILKKESLTNLKMSI